MRLVVLMVIALTSGYARGLTGDNICPETQRYMVNVTRSTLKNVQIRHYQWCVNVPPRCSYYTEEERYVPETVEEEEFRLIDKCCPGFKQDDLNQTCISECDQCKHGHCQTNRCVCDPGFEGDNCDNVCSNSRWGVNCGFTCTCSHGDCDPESGRCICFAGWKGERCNEELTLTVSTVELDDMSKLTQLTTTNPVEKVASWTPPALNRTQHPTLQKYYTFFITTQTPQLSKTPHTKSIIFKVPSSSNGRLTGITWLAAPNATKSTQSPELELESTTKIQSIKDTPSNLEERKHAGVGVINVNQTMFSLTEDDWINNETEEFKNDLVIHYDQSPHLVFSVGAIIGITATVMFMAATLFVIRIYIKQRPASLISVVAKSSKGNDGNGVCIYTSSVFHSPLPDPPTFENPGFTTPIDIDAKTNEYGNGIHAQVIYSMQVPTHSTFKTDSQNINAFYDHPPSTGSYRAASIPELPVSDQCVDVSNCTEQNEHLYDEIPCWKRPVNHVNDDNTLLCYYANCKDVS